MARPTAPNTVGTVLSTTDPVNATQWLLGVTDLPKDFAALAGQYLRGTGDVFSREIKFKVPGRGQAKFKEKFRVINRFELHGQPCVRVQLTESKFMGWC